MGLKLSNNADGLLALAISDSDTSLTLEAGHGSRFPALGSGDWFPITVVRASDPTQLEIMRCTGRSGDTLTVERAQEGTSALAFDPGDVVELRLTSGTLEENFPQVEGRNAKNLRFSIDSVGGKPELKFKSGDDEETVVRQSDIEDVVRQSDIEDVVRSSDLGTAATRDVGTSAGNVMEVGAFGLGRYNDLRNTIYTTGAPKDLYGKGYVIGFTDGSQLSPPIGTSLNYGTLEVKFQWNDSSGRLACSRTFTTADKVFVQRAVDDDTWGPWREFYHTGNDSNLVKTSRTISTGTGLTGGGNLSANRTISLASSHWPIGVGQTWQNVTSSRAAGTTYTNSTGRPIAVLITLANAIWCRFYVGGVEVFYLQNLSQASTVFAIVPPGSTYRLDISGKIDRWAELR